MSGVFVSYRRDDSQGFAGRLADDLGDLLGQDRVFRDIEIPVGSDFTDVLHRAIAGADVLLVVIGPQWAAADGYGSRLFEPTDWVRTEIEAAFAQGKVVVPILVGGAEMPGEGALPPTIARLAKLQAAEFGDRGWDRAVEGLVEHLCLLCPSLTEARPVSGRATSPAEVLHDLGERLLDEVAARRRPRLQPPRLPPTSGQRLLWALGRGMRRLAIGAALLAALYVGVRLFGDRPMLDALDSAEARLQIGWQRLQAYLAQL